MRVLARPLAFTVAALIVSVPILVAVGAPAQAAPATIAITTPADGSRTDDWTPPINGTSDVFSGSITLTIDGGAAVSVATNNAGDWTLTSTPKALAEGSHTALATATDATGNLATDSTTFIVDLTQKRPKLGIRTPANESATNDSTPAITGTSDVISGTITVAIDDGPQITVPTSATGTWTLISPRLIDGQHFAVARAVNADGYTETGPANFLVDATPPVFAISTPVNGSTIEDPTPTVAGTFDPAMERGFSRFGTITITIDSGAPITFNNNTSRAGIITGNWSLRTTSALGNGPHVIVARGVDFVGNSSTATSRFTVNAAAAAVPPSLANTGPDPLPLLALAILLVLMGAGAVRLGSVNP